MTYHCGPHIGSLNDDGEGELVRVRKVVKERNVAVVGMGAGRVHVRGLRSGELTWTQRRSGLMDFHLSVSLRWESSTQTREAI